MIHGRRLDQIGVVLNSQLKSVVSAPTLSRKASAPSSLHSDLEIPLVNKVASTATNSKPASRNHSRQISLHAFTSPNKGSKQVINVQQQIIIQQQINNSPLRNQAIRPKKKKKTTKRKKTKKVKSPIKSPAAPSPPKQELMPLLLGTSLQKFKQQIREDRMQKELERQRVTSLQDLKKYMDFEIRRMNNERFAKRPTSPQLPWGINQAKLRDYWDRMIDIHSKLSQAPPAPPKAREQQRRQDLGVGFLNQLPEKLVDSIIQSNEIAVCREQKQQPQQVLHVPQAVQPPIPTSKSGTSDRVRSYMHMKQAQWRQHDFQQKQQQVIVQEKLQRNLSKLKEEITQQKQRQYSVSSNRRQSNYHPSASKVLSNSRKSSVQNIVDHRARLDRHYESLHQEYSKLFNWREMQNTSPKPHTNQEFIEWLQSLPESFLEQQLTQMQAINEQMNAQGFNYILSEAEQYQFLEQFLKQKFKRHKEQIKSNVVKPNKKKAVEQVEQRYNKLQQRWLSAATQFEQQRPQQEPNEQDLADYLELAQHDAATTIQKMWRGYQIRKIIQEYREYAAEQQSEGIPNDGSSFNHEIYFPETHQEVPLSPVETKAKEDLKQVLGVVRPQTRPVPSSVVTSGSLVTIQELHSEVQSPHVSVIPQQQHDQIEKWDHMVMQLQQESGVGRMAVNFIDKLQQQSKLNLQMLNGEEAIKRSLEAQVDQSDEQPKVAEEGTQTEEVAVVKSERSKDDSELDYQFNISFVFANREQALEQRYQHQFEIMERMLASKKVSADSFSKNYSRLDKRMRRERASLKAQKTELQRVQELFRETIKQTKRDQALLDKMKRLDDDTVSFRQFLSMRSDTEQSDPGEQYNLCGPKRPALKIHNQSASSLDQRSQSFDQEPKEQLSPADLNVEYRQKEQFLTVEDQEEVYVAPPENDHIFIQAEEQPVTRNEEQIDYITDTLLYGVIEEFASELNHFPISSLGVLMEWDEESEPDQKQVQGFPTTLNFIKDYLLAFNDFIQRRHLVQFLQTINSPLGISPLELLKTISLSEISTPSLDESQSGPLYPLIKHIHMMEPVIEEEQWEQFCLEQATQGKLKYALTVEAELEVMRDNEQCHLRMIYEAFNEALNYIRPYGIRGQPYPWMSNPLKVYAHSTSMLNIEKAMGFAIAKMLKWGAFLCGFIPEKIETPQGEVILIEEDYLTQIKEDRLQQMLENELQETDEKWLAYEEEMTEVCVELADIVFEMMLDEASEDLMGIVLRSRR